jgi:ectoine hydroxylase-related dioxygenase (phytanoyl-CoA dioxygenase family)
MALNPVDKSSTKLPARQFSIDQRPSLAAFQKLCSENTTTTQYLYSETVESNVPIYNLLNYNPEDPATNASLQSEWYHILLSGPGVFVLRHMYPETALLEKVNEVFQKTIVAEKSTSSKGDHFAGDGKNDRIWNSFSKHGLQDPTSFFEYYSNRWLALVSEAWLGPGYSITAQVNIVKPGGDAQVAHRDYHMGFQTAEECVRYPKGMHVASQFLTLQGAVAHSDMPHGTGSTRLLPFSQRFEEGFMAYRLPEFNEYFLSKYVSLPLKMGDGLFFNPALFHAAGSNQSTDFVRKANLLQISSAFGKTMETIDGIPLIEKCWNDLNRKYDAEGFSGEVKAFVAAVVSGYAFPTNLDIRSPAPGGLAPESEQQTVLRALKENWNKQKMLSALHQLREDSRA